MRIAIVGAGAIGAYLGAKLARAGEDVALIARGPHLEAMRRNGVRVIEGDGEFTAKPFAAQDPAEIGPVDVVMLTVKAHSLPPMAPTLTPLLGPETAVVTGQNGIPWWYLHRKDGGDFGVWTEERLQTLDPGGVVSKAIETHRVVGCVVYPATVVEQPGVVRHIEGNRFTLGEPDNSKSQRVADISQALIRAGLRAPISTNIRQDIWIKLMGSMAFNPISALTRATLAQLATDSEVSAITRKVMEEADAVARSLGVDSPISVERRLAGAAKVGDHKTSMLQDLEAGRPMELEALVGAVLELGRRQGIPMPHTETVYACARLLEKNTRK